MGTRENSECQQSRQKLSEKSKYCLHGLFEDSGSELDADAIQFTNGINDGTLSEQLWEQLDEASVKNLSASVSSDNETLGEQLSDSDSKATGVDATVSPQILSELGNHHCQNNKKKQTRKPLRCRQCGHECGNGSK